MASNSDDFLKFVDHSHVDDLGEYDRMIQLAFSHPYLLHIILGLSALHMLHSDPENAKLYEQASLHSLSAHRLARPQIKECNSVHSNALYCFTGFASLYATAEPPLRLGSSKLDKPEDCLTALLDAFEMGRGVAAIMTPHRREIEKSGFLEQERWKYDRDDSLASLMRDYPQLPDLETLIGERCDDIRRGPCIGAARLLFKYLAVLEREPINHSSVSLIQRWPMDIDVTVQNMARENDPVALVILAHYAAVMHSRRNYWFFARWPVLLLKSIEQMVPPEFQMFLRWPSEVVRPCDFEASLTVGYKRESPR